MKTNPLFSGALIAVLMGMAYATAVIAEDKAPDPKAGEEKAAACFGCHGEKGVSEAPEFPKLAGQYAKYIVKQVQDYQKDLRTNETMVGMAMTVTEKWDLEDIAAYFAAQPVMQGAPVTSALAEKGRELYNAKYTCNRCHGENGKGKGDKMALFPRIGGQHKDYLVATMKDFRTGARKNDMTGLMAPLAKGLKDEEIEAIAEYLSGQ